MKGKGKQLWMFRRVLTPKLLRATIVKWCSICKCSPYWFRPEDRPKHRVINGDGEGDKGFHPSPFTLHPLPANQQGFTLLELLIALLLLSLIAGIVYGGLSVSLKMWQSGEAKAEEYQRLRVSLNQLLEEIRSAYPATIKPEDSLDPVRDSYVAFWGEADRLRFVTNTAGLVGEPINNWPRTVEYYANSDKGLLMREVGNYYNDCFANLEKESPITVDPEISQIKFRYYFVPEKKKDALTQQVEPVTGEWYDEWDPTSIDPGEKVEPDEPNPRRNLPNAVEITLTLKAKTPYDEPLTLPPMVVPIYCKQSIEAPEDNAALQTHP